jgi:D-ribose pyranase
LEVILKKKGILNPALSEVVASMGHFDQITVCDAGLPIPLSVQRIDLAVAENIPGFIEVVRAVSEEIEVQRIVLAEEAIEKNPSIVEALQTIFRNVEITYVTHESFKLLTQKSRAIIRTGECSPYANVILESGVIF